MCHPVCPVNRERDTITISPRNGSRSWKEHAYLHWLISKPGKEKRYKWMQTSRRRSWFLRRSLTFLQTTVPEHSSCRFIQASDSTLPIPFSLTSRNEYTVSFHLHSYLQSRRVPEEVPEVSTRASNRRG